MNAFKYLTPDWDAPRNVHAAFTLRQASGEAHVDLRKELSLPADPAWLEQMHGIEVVDLDDFANTAKPRADASVTRRPGRVCVVRAADCMPVLFAARDGKAVGAAHAGWRGLAAGVLEATVAAMRVDARTLVAWMGPCIGPADFEVGDEVRAAFLAHHAKADAAFSRNARGRWQCDLYALARQRMTAVGIQSISGGGWSTFADPERFYSYRRDGQTGRMAALIWLA